MNADLLTPLELSRTLKVSLHTIYYWVSRKEVPFFKVGKHLRFRLDDVLSNASWRTPSATVQVKSSRSLTIRSAGPAALPKR